MGYNASKKIETQIRKSIRRLIPAALGLGLLMGAGCEEGDTPLPNEAGQVITDGNGGGGDLGCGPGATPCGGVCVNTASDNKNCGACANACKAGQVCSGSKCSTSCQSGLTDCSGKCVSTQKDWYNCGACANACKAGEVCSAGKCARVCQSGLTDCSGICADTSIDSENCGACANACKTGEVCAGGKCLAGACPSPLSSCGGGDAGAQYCANLTNDPQNCGACAGKCPTAHVCSASKCALVCASSLTKCGGGDAGSEYCADLKGDNTNCGACGNACKAGSACSAGKCVFSCPGTSSQCGGGDAGTPFCADLAVDQKNCGKCGAKCGPGQFCLNGKCVLSCPSPMTMCFAGSPVYYDAGLPDLGVSDSSAAKDVGPSDKGAADLDGASSTDLDAAGDSSAGTDANADAASPAKYPYCATLTSDNDNCGKCAKKCPTGYVCSNGSCGFTCHSSHTQCGGGDSGSSPFCTNLQTDFHNCGKCGNKCFLAQLCKAGKCTLFCPGGLSECSGICVNLKYDDANCGKCNNACTAKTHACYEGTCQTKCQSYGYIRCSGTCLDARKDAKNCGVCGNSCTSGETCQNGGCACLTGATKCSAGCALLTSDPKNCGKCGNVCSSATPYCVGSKCIATSPSCKAILSANTSAPSGVYTVAPSGAAAPFKVYCDMTTDSGGWTLAARFSNADGTKWIDSGAYWYDRKTELGAPTVRGTNADAISQAFWTVTGSEFKLARTDAATDAHLLKTKGSCLGGKTFRAKVTGFGDFRKSPWASDKVLGTCDADLGGNYSSTSGFKYATCYKTSSYIGKAKSISFFADWSSGDGAVLMIGGGGSSCGRADHGIAVTEEDKAAFGTSKSRSDFGNGGNDGSKTYGLNLFVR